MDTRLIGLPGPGVSIVTLPNRARESVLAGAGYPS